MNNTNQKSRMSRTAAAVAMLTLAISASVSLTPAPTRGYAAPAPHASMTHNGNPARVS